MRQFFLSPSCWSKDRACAISVGEVIIEWEWNKEILGLSYKLDEPGKWIYEGFRVEVGAVSIQSKQNGMC